MVQTTSVLQTLHLSYDNANDPVSFGGPPENNIIRSTVNAITGPTVEPEFPFNFVQSTTSDPAPHRGFDLVVSANWRWTRNQERHVDEIVSQAAETLDKMGLVLFPMVFTVEAHVLSLHRFEEDEDVDEDDQWVMRLDVRYVWMALKEGLKLVAYVVCMCFMASVSIEAWLKGSHYCPVCRFELPTANTWWFGKLKCYSPCCIFITLIELVLSERVLHAFLILRKFETICYQTSLPRKYISIDIYIYTYIYIY